jgi:hypothetical protein
VGFPIQYAYSDIGEKRKGKKFVLMLLTIEFQFQAAREGIQIQSLTVLTSVTGTGPGLQ